MRFLTKKDITQHKKRKYRRRDIFLFSILQQYFTFIAPKLVRAVHAIELAMYRTIILMFLRVGGDKNNLFFLNSLAVLSA